MVAGMLKRLNDGQKLALWIIFVFISCCLCFYYSYKLFGVHPPSKDQPTKPDDNLALYFISSRLPTSLLINGERWELSPAKFSDKNVIGWTDCDVRLIAYNFDNQARGIQREVLWHEISHAILCNKRDISKVSWELLIKNDDNLDEHNIVYQIGAGMASFARDNPEFMTWAEDWSN